MRFMISVMELEQYLDAGRAMYLVDLRDWTAYVEGHIRGAVNIPAEELMMRLEELPPKMLIVLYCYHGPHSMRMSRRLAAMGYTVADVYGGIQAYRGKHLVQGPLPNGI